MKFIATFITLVITFLTFTALGQGAIKDQVSVHEPEYEGVFLFLDSTTGNLNNLEGQTPELKVKTKLLGVGGGEAFLEFKGEKSTVRFKEGRQLNFVVLVSSQKIDPQGNLQFFTLESKNGNRRMVTSKVGVFSTRASSPVGASSVPFYAKKYGQSSFKITPQQNLSPGEYVLGAPGTPVAFCFGIDAIEPIKQH